MNPAVTLRIIEPASMRGERELSGQAAALTFGRGDKADWKIEELSLSRLHARFRWEGGQLSVEDLGSLNGVSVNRRALDPMKPAMVRPGDRIQIGVVTIQVEGPPAAPEMQSATVYRPVTLAPEVESEKEARARRQKAEEEIQRAKAQGRATLRFVPASDAAPPHQKTIHYEVGFWHELGRYLNVVRKKPSGSTQSSRWMPVAMAFLLGLIVALLLMPKSQPPARKPLAQHPASAVGPGKPRSTTPESTRSPTIALSASRPVSPEELRDAIFAYSEADYPRALDLYRQLQSAQPQDESFALIVRILERKVSERQ